MNDELKKKVLKIIGLADAPADLQEQTLGHIWSIAHRRLQRAIPEMLNKEQLKEAEAMLSAGKSDAEISDWVKQQLPQYDKMIEAIILDVAEEGAIPTE